MPVERSAGALIFRKEGSKIYYLLLHYPSSAKAKKDYWDFSKGHIEKGEDILTAIKREVVEETGLKDLKFVDGFQKKIEYFFKFQGQTIFKTVVFYLAETQTKDIKLSHEHIGFKWLPFEGAMEQLTFKNAKDNLTLVNQLLNNG